MRKTSPSNKHLLLISLAIGAATIFGCSRDPQVAKQKYLAKGAAYYQQGKYREAAIEYQNAIQIDPRFARAHYELAQCYLKQLDWYHAYQSLLSAVSIEPANWKAQLDLANLLLSAGKFLDARERAQLILKGDPQNAEAQVILSESDATQGDLAKALSEAQQAVSLDPSRSASYLNLAHIQARTKDAISAEHSFQRAITLDPKSIPVTLALGNFYESQRRWQESEKLFQTAISLDPQNVLPRATLAALYLREGQNDRAEQVMREAKAALKDKPGEGYRILGDFYLTQGEMDKAAAEFASLYAERPKDVSIAKSYVQLLVTQGRLDEATKINDGILKRSPSDPDALMLRGQILTRQGKTADAVHVLELAVKAAPENALAHYHLGVAYADNTNFGQAEAEWRQAARLRPGMIEAQRALSVLALRKGDISLLAESGGQIKKIAPNSPEGYIFHGRALFAGGDLAGAEADLKKAIEIAPQNASAYTRMCELRMAQKRYDDAAKFCGQALDRDPSAVDALTGLANIDLERKQSAKALRRVQDQIARVPNNSSLYLLLGQVELWNQDSGKAEAAFQKAIDLDQNNVPAFLLLARLQVSRGSAEQAIGGYWRALQTNSRDVRLYVGLASLLETRNQWQQAEDLYQKALQIQPDYPLAANNLAYLMLEHGGNINVAFSLAQTGRRGLPDLPNSADTLGWAYYHQGVYKAAIDLFQEAIKGDSKNPTYHYHLGMAYQKTNNYTLAKKQLEYTLQINPNFSEAVEIRKILNEGAQHN